MSASGDLIRLQPIASFVVRRVLCCLELFAQLREIQHLFDVVIHEFVTRTPINTSAVTAKMEPSPTTSPAEEVKRTIIRRLMNYFRSRSIDERSCDLLYRMIMLISGVGADIHVIVESGISHPSTLRRIEWYINSELEACDFLREHFESRCQNAQRATGCLPRLAILEGVALEGALDAWRPVLR